MLNRLFQNMAVLLSIVALGLVGCETASEPAPKAESEHHEGDGHDHGHADGHPTEGPHHGQLIELGSEEYHAELTHDESTNTITIYLLGSDAKSPVAIAEEEILLNLVTDGQPLQAKLAADPQEDDPEGESSRFTLVDETAMEALEAPGATARLSVAIKGTYYSGSVEHHEHAGHGH